MSNDFEINHKVWAESWKAWVLIIGLIIATAAVCYGVQPWFLQQENANVRASLSYINTHQGILRQLKTSYDGVDVRLGEVGDGGTVQSHGLTNQQRSILVQMRQEADLIPNNVPADIRDFLASH
jgi:hypothetical protein